MIVRCRWRAVGIATALLVAFSVGGLARAADSVPPDRSFWVDANAGMLVLDTVALDGAQLAPSSLLAPSVSLGAHFRFGQLDIGVLAEQLGSGGYILGGSHRVGASFRLGLTLRWRYIEGSWGAVWGGISPGWGRFMHSRALRLTAARVAGSSASNLDRVKGNVDTITDGFVFAAGTGVLFYLTRGLVLNVGIGTIDGRGSLTALGHTESYSRTRFEITVGIEWYAGAIAPARPDGPPGG